MSWKIEGRVELEKCSHRFAEFARENAAPLERHLGLPVFPGSLNIWTGWRNIGDNLDLGFWPKEPDIVIPKGEFRGMPAWLGDGRAWRCRILSDGTEAAQCFLFRRRGSRVRPGVIEILAGVKLTELMRLRQGQAVAVEGDV